MGLSSNFKLGYAVGHADAFLEAMKKEQKLLDRIRELEYELSKYKDRRER